MIGNEFRKDIVLGIERQVETFVFDIDSESEDEEDDEEEEEEK